MARPGIFPETASMESRVIPQGTAPRKEASQKEKEKVTTDRANLGAGEGSSGKSMEQRIRETTSGTSRKRRRQAA